ncbi:MAG: DUF4203 domain-containing protein [Anaerolineales bacterium]|jgi:hypothetical protein
MAKLILIGMGLVLLVAGRKLFWLFVGTVGFVIGFFLANNFFPGESEITRLALGLVVGVIGALLAVFLKKIAVGLAGFISGGLLAVNLAGVFSFESAMPIWMLFVLGGIIGVVLVALLFDWGLIILSSLVGAYLIAFQLDPGGLITTAVFVGLFLVGLLLQSKLRRG